MRINEFSYLNKKNNWNLKSTKFNDFTLLVGVSGVGKSKILRALLDIKLLAEGKIPGDIKWTIKFETSIGKEYIWEGEIEQVQEDSIFESPNNSNIANLEIKYEKLILNGTEIFVRDKNKCIFLQQVMPKLSFTESLIFTLKEEPLISQVLKGFKQIIFSESNSSVDNLLSINQLYNKYASAEKVISSDLAIIVKLTLIYQNDRNLFNQIKETFCDIFPNIEDIKIEPLNIEHLVFKELPLLQIKEYSVDYWIPFDEISSGMLRTLTILSQIYLNPPNSVILIDNIEDHLGVNCIDFLIDKIIQNPNNSQVILTSHHPYIINAIPINALKLVIRNKNIVKILNVETLHSWSKSNHEIFIKLVNLPEFENGITNG